MRILSPGGRLAILLMILVPLLQGGCDRASQHKASEMPATRSERVLPDSVISASVWYWGETTGHIKVNVVEHTIEARGVQLSSEGWRSFESNISKTEADSLRSTIARAQVEHLTPQEDWFGERNQPGGGTVLQVTLRDEEVVLAIPPESLRVNLPPSAERRYLQIDEIVGMIERIQWKYADLGPLVEVPETEWTKILDDFGREMDATVARSRPRGRKGW